MSDSPLIAQPGHQKMTLLRESYLAICDNDPCAARLLNAVERWHHYKLRARDEVRGRNHARRQGGLKASGDEDLWVRMAIDPEDAKSLGWRAELMNEYSYKVVKRALDRLVNRGLIAKRNNPRQSWDRTPQWLFQVQAVQQAVDAWGLSRDDPGMGDDPDGNAATPEGGENAAADGAANLADSTRQIDRVDTAQQPNQIGLNTESSRQIDRSNNTEILLQESLPEIPQQTSPSPELVPGVLSRRGPDDDGGSAMAEKDQETQPLPEGGGNLPFFGDDQTGGPGIRLDSGLDGPEKVPPGGPALLTLVPVPRDVLERRPPRDPLTLSTLRAILKASHASRAAHLHASLALATHSGVPRELLTRLTESEIGRAITAACADTPLDQTGQGFDRMVVLALDVLIGEPVTAEMIAKGRQKPDESKEPLGPSSRVLNGRQASLSTDPEKPGALDLSTHYLGHWVLKAHPDQAVEVTRFEERPGQTPLLHLRGGKTMSTGEITLKYRRPAVSAETNCK